MKLFKLLTVAGVSLAMLPGAANADKPPTANGSADAPTKPKRAHAIRVTKDGKHLIVVSEYPAGVELHKPGKYWVGLNCTQVGEALRSHLRLSKPTGLLVLDVVGKSPAENAGVKKHDVLLKIGKTELVSVPVLVGAVQKIGTRKTSIQLFREGKKLSIEVTPAVRPSSETFYQLAIQEAEELLNRKSKQLNQRIRVVGPGVVVNRKVDPLLNKNVENKNIELRITKSKDGKTAISVKVNGKSYSTTGDKLDKLPKDVRVIVERALKRKQGANVDIDFMIRNQPYGPNVGGFWMRRWPGDPYGGGNPANIPAYRYVPQVRTLRVWPHPTRPTLPARTGNVEKKLDAINKKLDALQNAIEKLQSGRK